MSRRPWLRALFPLLQEGWPSGLRRTPGKRVGVNAPPGFESPSLRHLPKSSRQLVSHSVTLKFFNSDV